MSGLHCLSHAFRQVKFQYPSIAVGMYRIACYVQMRCPLLNVWRRAIASCRFHQSQANGAEPIESEVVAPLLREDDESRR